MLIRTESDQRKQKEIETAPIAPDQHAETPEAAREQLQPVDLGAVPVDDDRLGFVDERGESTAVQNPGENAGAAPGSYDDERDDLADELGSYEAMFREYLREQRHWIGALQQPLVFHIRKLCRRLDTDEDAPASFASAYLQAISRLDKMRPGAPAPQRGELPGQGSIFDELED